MTKPPPLDIHVTKTDADTLREIAVEIERYNHMKAAKKLTEIADRCDYLTEHNDKLNLCMGLLIGQMSRHKIVLDEYVVEYLKERGIFT